ncbi:hypothetical protein BH23GEM6_BH23GEM6_23770 [soil metagenome]
MGEREPAGKLSGIPRELSESTDGVYLPCSVILSDTLWIASMGGL